MRQSQPRDLLYEVRADHSSEWLEKSNRELYEYVLACIATTHAAALAHAQVFDSRVQTVDSPGALAAHVHQLNEDYTDLQVHATSLHSLVNAILRGSAAGACLKFGSPFAVCKLCPNANRHVG